MTEDINEVNKLKYFGIACKTIYYGNVEDEDDIKLIMGTLIGMMVLEGMDEDDISEVFMKVMVNHEEIISDIRSHMKD